MTAPSTTVRFDRAIWLLLADWLAVVVAVVLPWSTSATGICIALWLVALLPTLDWAAVKREVMSPAGGLPVLLWALGATGMLWADVDWHARLGGLDGFHRLLAIPLVLIQFRRSKRGIRVLWGFFISCGVLLIASYVLAFTPGLTWRGRANGVPVHDDIFQNTEFLVCAFAAIGVACAQFRKRHWPLMLAFLAIAALFLANMAFVFLSRAALLVIPALALLLGWRELRWKGCVAAIVLASLAGATMWVAAPALRGRIEGSLAEIRDYRATNAATPIGQHTAFLKESIGIIADAPIIGHGTGSIPEQFRRITVGAEGVSALNTVNPHNQTFAVAIQLGIVGAVLLWAMWVVHFRLFCGGGTVAWFGIVVVMENIVSSAVHSHLFDFANGWLYVFGVGVLGGMVLRERDKAGGAAG
jgi:O-antigen ligase